MNIDDWKAEQKRLAKEYADAGLDPTIVAFLNNWDPDEFKVEADAEWAKDVESLLNELNQDLAKPEAELDEETIDEIQKGLKALLRKLGVKPPKKRRGVRSSGTAVKAGAAKSKADQLQPRAPNRMMLNQVANQTIAFFSYKLARDVVAVVRSGMSTDTDVEDEIDHKPLDDIERIIFRAANEGIDSLISHDWKVIVKFGQQKAKELAKEEAAATVERLAHELFPELEDDENVTAKQLTTCFAKRANPSDGSEPVRLKDETKRKFINLAQAWKACGNAVEYKGQAARLELGSHGSQEHKKKIVVAESRKGTHEIDSFLYPPAITFLD
ncbi:hypothetical protein [Rhodopirellula europaea]|uniref:Uncharacterized protein n=1 Tax=Rhodopirellula europaea SH398 TaxID=1263868 RepID=M5S8S4_9BACT|nr:hypothetical protein [Rhodopirellula europaea]EMI24062.1 hypothetical protein RESH_05384 [Rhodopirellula europaea SH398]